MSRRIDATITVLAPMGPIPAPAADPPAKACPNAEKQPMGDFSIERAARSLDPASVDWTGP